MAFMNSRAAWLLMMLALGASALIGVDLLSAGASLLLVAAWLLLAPVIVLVLMFSGLHRVASLVAVLEPEPLSDRTWESCEPKRLRRPPRA
ncbi:hypothetical protein HZ992_16635 [Rhizobacter sp. AJA081-3]|uniref:hypothetical protein n=1 Tax=Rhizobacter sp. AJA081-3 TaxID=2753607 RepID=UPI001ADFF5E1|nr:hypothetical protein [Rhizobacter sp. AJA081-3]QTN21793.1 hypothetical protein HZ992_16635 [Rhizobacter sp. AJA081-3]